MGAAMLGKARGVTSRATPVEHRGQTTRAPMTSATAGIVSTATIITGGVAAARGARAESWRENKAGASQQGLRGPLEINDKLGISGKLAPYIIKVLGQGLVDANCAKEAWEAVILRVASPPTDSHLDEEQIVERCKTWQNTVDNAKVMIGIAKSHDA